MMYLIRSLEEILALAQHARPEMYRFYVEYDSAGRRKAFSNTRHNTAPDPDICFLPMPLATRF
jgi:hypothetical protein